MGWWLGRWIPSPPLGPRLRPWHRLRRWRRLRQLLPDPPRIPPVRRDLPHRQRLRLLIQARLVKPAPVAQRGRGFTDSVATQMEETTAKASIDSDSFDATVKRI